jgi:hypothetical protein
VIEIGNTFAFFAVTGTAKGKCTSFFVSRFVSDVTSLDIESSRDDQL